MGWLEDFKEDVLRVSAGLPPEDDYLIPVSHKQVDRLIAIAEEREFVCEEQLGRKCVYKNDVIIHHKDCKYHEDWKP